MLDFFGRFTNESNKFTIQLIDKSPISSSSTDKDDRETMLDNIHKFMSLTPYVSLDGMNRFKQ